MTKTTTQEVLSSLDDVQAAQLKILLERGIKIPPQPRVVEVFRNSVKRGVKDVRALARVLNDDPGIVGMLFKVMQSPVYRAHRPFDSVEKILHAVGIQQTLNLVQALAFCVSLDNAGRGQSQAFEAYWARSRSIAMLAMLIAEMQPNPDVHVEPDHAYMAGIFHDCGVPVLMQRFPTYCDTMSLNTPGCWADLTLEDKKFFADHAVVGYLIGRHWNLPDYVASAIRYHHDLAGTTPPAAAPLVATVQYAVELYHRDISSSNPDWEKQRIGIYAALQFPSKSEEEFFGESVMVAFDALAE